MRFLLDTNIISDLVRNPAGLVAERIRQVGEEGIATNVVVAGELLYGCRKKGSRVLTERVEAILSEIEVLPVLADVADAYGVIRANLEGEGVPIGQNDLWIAAQAKMLEATLVTANEGEFRRVDGLAVENWLGSRRSDQDSRP